MAARVLNTGAFPGGVLAEFVQGTRGLGGTVGVDFGGRRGNTPDVSAIVPNLATSFDVSAAGTEFTFYLRPGTRWSDGDEFSAEDFVWWYENILMNMEMTPRPWSWLTVAGEPVVVDKIDEHTVRFRFAAAYGLFTAFLSASQRLQLGLLSPPPPIVGVVNAKLRNVPERAPYSDIARSPGSFIPEQFFYAE